MQSALLTLILSFLIMMAVGPACIPLLQRWKFGQTERMDYICTGGGALIRFLSGEELPVVRALREAARRETKT